VRRSVRKWLTRFNNFNSLITVALIGAAVYDFVHNDLPIVARETLRAMGLDYRDDDELSIAGFTAVMARQTGIPFRDLSDATKTKEDLAAFAFDGIYQATGFRPTSLEPEQFKADLVNFLLNEIANPSNAAPGIDFVNQVKKVARDAKRENANSFLPLGWSEHLSRWTHREAQRDFAATHNQVWSFDNLVYRDHWTPHVRPVAGAETVKAAHDHNKRHVWMREARGLPATAELISFSDGSHYFMTWPEAMRRHYRGYYDFPSGTA